MLKLARCIEDLARAKETMDDVSSIISGVKTNPAAGNPKIQLIKKCDKCGTLCREDSTKCFKCGSNSLITVPNLKNIQFCSNCENQIQPGATFCGKCGMKIN